MTAEELIEFISKHPLYEVKILLTDSSNIHAEIVDAPVDDVGIDTNNDIIYLEIKK